jgi:hypothetical protein
VAARLSEYDAPAVTEGRELVLIDRSGTMFTGVIVSSAVEDFVPSATLVAVTVAFVFALTLGAVYKPLLLIVPVEAAQVTATFDVLVTEAVNCSVPDEVTLTLAGVTVTPTEVAFDTDKLNALVPVRPVESTACTVNAKEPELCGVPEIVPVEVRINRPVGKFPEVTLKV